jgi:response regulator RpfG family c-di-GMP phosphodiesterase
MNAQNAVPETTDPLRLAAEPVPTRLPTHLPGHGQPWKVLIVDDEEQVHVVTRLALEGFEFANRKLELLSAYTGEEARKIIAANPDIALILLDVVMETDQAGLEVARYIREELQNRFVRIVLRTGQPGQAPEHKVITGYDINDYKEKTELTRQKLFTTVYTSLSSYRDLVALDGNRRGLVKVIEASARIFELRSMEYFAEGVLEQLTALLYLDQDAMVIMTSGLAADRQNGTFNVVAATGRFRQHVGQDLRGSLHQVVLERVGEALKRKSGYFGDTYYVGYYQTDSGVEHLLYVSANAPISVPDRNLIELFARNVSIAHENVRLMSQTRHSRA